MQDGGSQALVIIGWVQSAIFVAQLFVFGYQALKLHQTVQAAAQQSGDMKRSIEEATRAAAEHAQIVVRCMTHQRIARFLDFLLCGRTVPFLGEIKRYLVNRRFRIS